VNTPRLRHLLGALLAAAPALLPAQPPSAAAIGKLLDSLVPAAIARYQVPGASLAIVRGDTVLALRGFGFARLEDSLPVDPERSVYRLASVAKLFVATVVLRQVAEGRLELDRDVAGYAPDVPIPSTFPGTITLHHLLTHTAGFDERVIGYGAPSRAQMRTLGEYLATRLPDRGWPPGTLVSYSNHGMALAALIAERRAGVPFGELAAREIFAPLGMGRTYYVDPPDSIAGDLAPGYRCGGGSCARAPVVWSQAYPVGLAFSTAADMSRFMRAELDGGRLGGIQVLPDSVVAWAQRRQFTNHPAVPGIGFAFFEQEHRGVRLVTHSGGVAGTAAVLALAPSERLGIFVVTNAGEPGFTRAVLDGLLDALLPNPAPAPPVASGPVSEYAGPYRLARYSHHTIERFPGVFASSVRATAVGDTLVLPLGSSSRRFVRVDSLLLHEVGGDGRMALRRDDSGRITHLFTGLPAGGAELPGAFERVPWYEAAYFLNEYASWLLLLPLIVLALWALGALISWLRRRTRGPSSPARPSPPPRLAVLAIVTVVAMVGLFLVFGFGFVAASTRDLGRGEGITFGVAGRDLLLLRLAWPVALAAVPIALFCLTSWRRRWWSWFGRLCYSVITVGAAAIAHFLLWWGYVPGRW
jgi:CubicO group peptidase (beta-lactamase class C family)